MSMPYIDDDLAEDESAAESPDDFDIEGSDLVLDMDEGDISISDGDTDLIDGEDALKQWIEKILKTRAFVYDIYDSGETAEDEDEDEEEYDDEIEDVYGCRLKDIMLDPDTPSGMKMSAVQREIETALEKHPDILSVSEFEFEQSGRTLIVSFVVESSYGEEAQEVTIDGTDSE